MNKQFISLFCGCGGFDIGFLEAGFRCQRAFDIDKVAVEAHLQNLNTNVEQRDLFENVETNSFKDVDVVLAGPPCQGFSTAGKRRYNDPRNHLLIRAVEISLSIDPQVIVIENVNGVVAGKHKRYWDRAKGMLNEKYQINEYILNTKDFGLAQLRKRRVLIALKNKEKLNFVFPDKTPLTLKHALCDINDSFNNHIPEFLLKGTDLDLIAQKIKPRQKLSNVRGGDRSVHTWDIPEVFGDVTDKEKEVLEALLKLRRRNRLRDFGDADPVTARAISNELKEPISNRLKSLIKKVYIRKIGNRYDLTNTFNGKFKRLSWDEPAPTVITRFGDPRYFLHPDENRGLTVREAARIQGFPDNYRFPGSKADQYRMVGNAVPPPMAKKIGEFIHSFLN